MIWLTYRQHRWEALIVIAVVVLVSFPNLIAGLRAPSVIAALGIPACVSNSNFGQTCSAAFDQFDRQFGWTRYFPILFVVLPALVAPFLGAPLVSREHEFRSSLLVWAQGVTRTRWLLVKLALFAGTLGAAALLLAAIAPIAAQAWNYRPMRWQDTFEWSAAVTVGTALFALPLGVFAGIITRRVLAAMLVALVTVALVRVEIVTQLRPRYVEPIVATSQRDVPADAWILGGSYVDSDGNTVPISRLMELNEQFLRTGSRAVYASSDVYFAQNGVFLRVPYQPREREGQLQAIEFGLYASLALALVSASLWLVRRRPA